MTAAEDLVITIERLGGFLEFDGDRLKYQLPDNLTHLLPRLKEHKTELVALVLRRGGRIAHFPMCPKCGAYCLHREGKAGAFKCQRCGQEAEEHDARIASFLKDSRAPQ